jgi:hypothetical protein
MSVLFFDASRRRFVSKLRAWLDDHPENKENQTRKDAEAALATAEKQLKKGEFWSDNHILPDAFSRPSSGASSGPQSPRSPTTSRGGFKGKNKV